VLAATVALAAVAAVAAPPVVGTTVALKVESSTDPVPLFSGSVETAPRPVDGGDGSGPHPCSGPPGATPAPTATGALDDGLRSAGISWQGNWNPSFRDFFIERIGPHASTPPDNYWSLSVNGRFSSGGCLAQIRDGDEVRFFYGPLFGAPPQPSPGGANGTADGQGANGGETNGGAAPRATDLRRLARRATRFLLRHNNGPGGEWAELVLALRGHGEPSSAAQLLARRLLDRAPNGPRPSDIDSAALDAWRLAVGGQPGAARRAAGTVRANQSQDGGFSLFPGGESNAQSTGVALVALRVAGLGPRSAAPDGPTPLDYLASLAHRNGSIAYAKGSSITPVWTTAQALLGLTSRDRLLDLDLAAAAG
jgi:hypothetical protein